ncbi:MAG: RpiB/LacA/LacB family sugar-phosphate isomerase [Candidatus Yanofskybacteria bacterium]|nr:RpiB/LacA/LacB family sugar-phosphate isomerase [Candidatus Yanofskybacteria bacterium]
MIYLASDHAGFELKEELKNVLVQRGFEVKDMGAWSYDPEDDYPDFILPAVKAVALRQAQGEHTTFGIVCGGSGQGEAMAANRVSGIRAAVYYGGSLEIVRLSRAHNNANVLALGARFMSAQEAREAVELWLNTEFEGGRHERRITKIDGS